jgi:hypothetical protein
MTNPKKWRPKAPAASPELAQALDTLLAPAPAKRPPGRPATGRTPAAELSARSKRALLDAGGRRLTVNLSPEAVRCIARIREEHQFDTDREAIEWALRRAMR